ARRNEDCATALPEFQRAVELDHKYPDAQLALGDCLTQMRKFNEAVTALQPGLNWGKWRPRFLVALGNVEMARDSLRDAGIYFTQAREAAPDDPITNKALGDFYLKRGIGSLAIPEYEKAVGLDSTDIDLRFALGRALAFDQRYGDAIEQYKWVAERNPDYSGAQLALGDIYYRAGQAEPRYYAEARPHLEKYTQLAANDPRGWSLLGRDLYYLREKEAGLAAMKKAEQLGDKSKDMYTVMFRALVDQKDWAGASAAIKKGDPSTSDLLKLAQVNAFLGNSAAADSVYRALIDKDSTSSDARFALLEMGKAQYRKAQATPDSVQRAAAYAVAIGTLTRRIALDPNNDEAYYYRGLSHKELKQFSDALADLRQAVTLAPTKGERYFWVAVTLSQAYPGCPPTTPSCGAQDSTAAALEVFKAMVAVDSTSKNAAMAYQQIAFREHLLKKDWNGAIVLLEKAVAIDPTNKQSLIWLAQSYQNAGNKGKALEYYDKVLQIDPNEPNAKKGKELLSKTAVKQQ
ncbi:MAG TPA: tetratricopeptide repeat protein, partial [Vicinamibacterales bacterium]|nr:tetratricopeptide repeat protein [Vicinamibacterales bacterium]